MTRSVVVTGSTSFVGCHLARAFAETGDTVIATHSRAATAYEGIAADRLAWISGSVRTASLDITNRAAVLKLARESRPNLWIHHAGYATNYGSPDYDRGQGDAINVAPLDAIFEAAAASGGGVLITGSNAEYANRDEAVVETDTGRPTLPYGQSKLAETVRACELSEKFGVPVRVGRLFIPFGRFDNPSKLLASVQRALIEGTPIDLSPCDQKRDFVGVNDVCSAWIKMANDLSRGGLDIFNICSGVATELKSLLLALADAVKADPALLRFGARPMRPGEPAIAFGNNDKARRLLNWSPRPLDRAIREDLPA